MLREKFIGAFKNWRISFTLERIICRLIAAWMLFSAVNLIIKGKLFFKLEYAQNTNLIIFAVSVASIFLLLSFINLLLSAYESDTWFLMLGASACAFAWLVSYDGQRLDKFLFSIAVALVFSLFVIYFVHKNELLWKKWNPKSRTVWIFAGVFGVICCAAISIIGAYRYLTFTSPNFDFGVFVNMFHNMKETGLPLVTCERDVLLSHFVVHISPIYYLILPFYAIFPSPVTLQISQAVILASGIIPVVLLCKHFKLSSKIAIAISALYAFYPALSIGTFYDIHENCFLTPLLLWLFYFYEKGKYIPVYIFSVLVLMVKEDAAIYLIIFAIYVLFAQKGKRRLHGLLLLGIAIAYFGTALHILEVRSEYFAELYAITDPQPHIAGPMVDRFNNLILNKDDGIFGVVKTALLNPGFLLTQLFSTRDGDYMKLEYVIQMLLPLACIPFFTKKMSRWLLISPILLNILTKFVYQYELRFQYHFGIMAFLFYVMIMNLPELSESLRKSAVSFAVAVCCCLYVINVVPQASYYAKVYSDNKETYVKLEEILDTIPNDASVVCSSSLLAHIADRDEIYEVEYHGGDGNVDYVVLDARYGVNQKYMEQYTSQGYTVKEHHQGYIMILWKNS